MRNPETRALIPAERIQSIDGHDLNGYFMYRVLAPSSILPPHIDPGIYKRVFDDLYINLKR